jgi:phenylpyruvate tautomerase PptA (4-oxalocrotonate tautomerase family)
MPIARFYLADSFTDEQYAELLNASCELMSEVLETPLDRTRAFVNVYPPGRASVGGQLVEKGGHGAPFFIFFMGEQRPPEHRPVLLARFTDLIENILGVDRSTIRGHAQPSHPDAWGVAGLPLSVARAGDPGAAL